MSTEFVFRLAGPILVFSTLIAAVISLRSPKFTFPSQILITLGFLISWSALEFTNLSRGEVANWISWLAIVNSFYIGRSRIKVN